MRTHIALAAAFVAAITSGASAQAPASKPADAPTARAPKRPAGDERPARAGTQPPRSRGRTSGSIILPDFNPKKQFQVIRQGLDKSIPIGKTIQQAQSKLGPLIERLKKSPDLEGEAAVERELSAFVDRLSGQVVELMGERDSIVWAFRDLKRGLGRMRSSIGTYVVDLKRRILGERRKMKRLESRLKKLAADVRSADGPDRARLGRQLVMLDRKHRLLASAMTQYDKLAASFGASGTGIDKLEGAFTRMSQNVNHLLDVLEVQYEILRFSAGTRRDFSRVKELFARVMGGSEADLKKIVDRLKDVNHQIAFLGDFMQTVGEINSFNRLVIDVDTATAGILDVGVDGAPKKGDDLDKLLDKWK